MNSNGMSKTDDDTNRPTTRGPPSSSSPSRRCSSRVLTLPSLHPSIPPSIDRPTPFYIPLTLPVNLVERRRTSHGVVIRPSLHLILLLLLFQLSSSPHRDQSLTCCLKVMDASCAATSQLRGALQADCKFGLAKS